MSWIFKYVRADGEEIDVGLYSTREESEEGRLYMEGLGALVSEDSIEVPDDYRLYKGEK
jgi:hypothetical protein